MAEGQEAAGASSFCNLWVIAIASGRICTRFLLLVLLVDEEAQACKLGHEDNHIDTLRKGLLALHERELRQTQDVDPVKKQRHGDERDVDDEEVGLLRVEIVETKDGHQRLPLEVVDAHKHVEHLREDSARARMAARVDEQELGRWGIEQTSPCTVLTTRSTVTRCAVRATHELGDESEVEGLAESPCFVEVSQSLCKVLLVPQLEEVRGQRRRAHGHQEERQAHKAKGGLEFHGTPAEGVGHGSCVGEEGEEEHDPGEHPASDEDDVLRPLLQAHALELALHPARAPRLGPEALNGREEARGPKREVGEPHEPCARGARFLALAPHNGRRGEELFGHLHAGALGALLGQGCGLPPNVD
mmetsp:Transcript_1464/g.4639  ORF Transcript_1464/g.4639 Transcript_1464/m.4639 type:complete len:359 (+) Transcript_1464:509-1585(+)